MNSTRLTIGEFSRLCRLTVVTLRHYDRVGLLTPAEIDSSTGYRYYDIDQVDVALRVALLRSLDVSIADLRRFVTGEESLDEILAAQRSRLTTQIDERARMVQIIDAMVRGTDAAPYDVVRAVEPERRVVGFAIDTSWSRVESATRHALARLGVVLRRAGIEGGATGALFPLDPGERVTVRVFVATDAVDAGAELGGRRGRVALSPLEVPSADAFSTIHRGDHRLLGYAYRALLGRVAAGGLEAIGPAREHYLTTGGVDVACTRLVIPVADAMGQNAP